MTIRIGVSVEESVLEEFDKITGLVKRSAYINNMMKKEVVRVKSL